MSGNRPTRKARAVGINHVALEVGDIDEALAFYGGFWSSRSRGGARAPPSFTSGTSSSLLEGPAGRRRTTTGTSASRWTTRGSCVRTLEEMGVELLGERFLDFLDPWGNRSRSRPTRTSSSRRPTTSFAAWGSGACARPTRPSRSSARRTWPRPDRRVRIGSTTGPEHRRALRAGCPGAHPPGTTAPRASQRLHFRGPPVRTRDGDGAERGPAPAREGRGRMRILLQ